MNKRLLRDCLQIAQKNNTPEKHPEFYNYAHFAFIIQFNAIVEWGVNRVGEPLTQYGYSKLAKLHAETEAYRKAKGILDHSKPFECVNVRLNKQGQVKISAPCHNCEAFLTIVGCKETWFTLVNGKWGKVKH